MTKRKVRKVFCHSCLEELKRVDNLSIREPTPTVKWIALRCPVCLFEVFSAAPTTGYAILEDSAIRLGARTYVLHSPPRGGYIPF